MRFGIFLRHYFPYGGLQRDALRLARAAQDLGHSPVVVVSAWEGSKPNEMDIRIIHARGYSNHQKESFFANRCRDIMFSEKLDTGIGFSRIRGVPFHFCGDFCFKEKFEQSKPQWMKWLPRYRYFLQTEKLLFDNPSKTHIFFLAESERKNFEKHYRISSGRHSLLPPWLKKPDLNQEIIETSRKHLLEPHGIPGNTPFLLFVGSDFHRKGLDLAIQALPHLRRPELHLLVCGQDDFKPYERISQELGVADRIHYLGPQDNIPAWMRSAECLIHPARAEPAGMVLIEALTHHLPVVCSKNCGYATHVQEAGCYPVSKDAEPVYIAKSLDRHLEERNLLKQKIEEWLNAEERYQTAKIILEKMAQVTSEHER